MYCTIFSMMCFLLCCTTTQTDTAQQDTSVEQRTWSSSLVDDERGLMMSIWEAGVFDIWIVGGQTDAGMLLRCQTSTCSGDDWEEIVLPQNTPLLNWIHGIDSEHVWVGGIDGTLLFWNGESWEDFSMDIPEAIWGIHASAEHVVVVGGLSRWGGEKAIIKTKEGSSFVDVEIPDVYSEVSNLFKVTTVGEDVWIVGEQGVLIHCRDTCTPIPTGIASDLITITSSGENVHLVGGRGTGMYAPIIDGELGGILPVPAGLNGVSALGNEVLVVGERGFAGMVREGQLEEIPSATLDVLHAALIDSQGRMFAVGGNLFTAEPTFHGVVLTQESP